MAVFAPMPSASVRATVTHSAGARPSERRATLRSPNNAATFLVKYLIPAESRSDLSMVWAVISPPLEGFTAYLAKLTQPVRAYRVSRRVMFSVFFFGNHP